MKDDLKRLMKEFLEETRDARIIEVQYTNDSPKKREIREATFRDFISWLNGDFYQQ